MRRISTILIALIGGVSATTWAREVDGALQQAGKAFGRLHGTVVIERRDADWRVVGLALYNSEVTDAELRKIAGLTTLERLKVHGGAAVTEEGWRSCVALPHLRHLTLPWGTREGALKSLTGLAELESLDLFGCSELTDAAPVHLAGLPVLRRLNLANTGVGDASLAHVGALHGLEELDLGCNSKISDAGLAALKGLTELRSLTLDTIGPNGVAALRSLPRLECLVIQQYISEADVLDLSGLTGLRSLTFGNHTGAEKGAVRFPPGLRHLGVGGWWVERPGRLNMGEPLPEGLDSVFVSVSRWYRLHETPPYLGWLEGLPGLREATLEDPTADETAAIAGLARLRTLTLTASCAVGPLRDEGVRHLAGLRQLESLSFRSDLLITDAGIRALGTLKGLRRLELGEMPNVTVAGLAFVAEMKGLEILRLALPRGALEDSVVNLLTGIAALGNLQELSLSAEVADKGLRGLARLKKLRRLDSTGCQGYTDAGLAALVKALPDLEEAVWTYRGEATDRH